MLDASERHGWVEAIKELKSQYYVGSQDAFRSIKAILWYEQVRADILRANPSLAQKFNLSVKMVTWMVVAVQRVLECVLDFEATKVSTCGHVSVGSQHTVVTPLESPRECSHRYMMYNLWTLDFSACLTAFLTDRLSGDHDGCFVVALAKWLRKNFRHGRICPVFRENGQPVSFSQFRSHRKFRQFDEEYLWGITGSVLEDAISCEKDGFMPNHQLLFDRALAGSDINAVHSLLQRLYIRHLRGEFQYEKYTLYRVLKSDLRPEDEWLYDSGLYERAEREYTLGLMEVERRIALNVIHLSVLNGTLNSPATLVEEILNDRKSRIRESSERMKSFSDNPSGKEQSRIRFLTEEARILKRHQYVYRALLQNKKWLIEFLSR